MKQCGVFFLRFPRRVWSSLKFAQVAVGCLTIIKRTNPFFVEHGPTFVFQYFSFVFWTGLFFRLKRINRRYWVFWDNLVGKRNINQWIFITLKEKSLIEEDYSSVLTFSWKRNESLLRSSNNLTSLWNCLL